MHRIILSLAVFASLLPAQGVVVRRRVVAASSPAPAFVQACSKYISGSPYSCAFVNNITSGNKIAVYVNVASGGITITSLAGGSNIASGGNCTAYNANTAMGTAHASLFLCPVTGTGAATLTATLSGSASDVEIFAHEVSNVSGVDNAQTGINAQSNCSSGCVGPTLTPTGSTDYVFVAGADDSFDQSGQNTSPAPAAGYTQCTGSGTNVCLLIPGGYHGGSAYKVLSGTSSVTPGLVFALTGNVPTGAMLLK